jgi:hypothetical protein
VRFSESFRRERACQVIGLGCRRLIGIPLSRPRATDDTESRMTKTRPALEAPIPILRMFDEKKTRGFYLDFLGFAVDFEHRFEPRGPLYMQVSLALCRLQLSEHFGDGTPGAKVKVRTKNLAAYQRALLAKKYRHARPGLTEHDWGERSMAIDDPAGNAIIFFERWKPEASLSSR